MLFSQHDEAPPSPIRPVSMLFGFRVVVTGVRGAAGDNPVVVVVAISGSGRGAKNAVSYAGPVAGGVEGDPRAIVQGDGKRSSRSALCGANPTRSVVGIGKEAAPSGV